MTPALTLYQWLTRLGSGAIYAYLKWRQLKGKEEKTRIAERFGHASAPRPPGRLWWLHAASVGEAVSLRPLLEAIHNQHPGIHLLLTSGTVSSARMLADTLPAYVTHHYMPVDTPAACQRFLAHWQPGLGIFTESEIWPNILTLAHQHGVKLALINARMSVKSHHHWSVLPRMAHTLLGCFSFIAAQTPADAERFESLGARGVHCLGQLKQDARELDVEAAQWQRWQQGLAQRPCLVAASIHPGEDELIAQLHLALKASFPSLLTICVPRHPPKAASMAESFKAEGLSVLTRTQSTDLPGMEHDIYLADTIGELGLWYRLAQLVIMGGSFVPHGGQNPLEAIRLQRAVITGPHTHNFAAMVSSLAKAGAIIQLPNTELTPLAQRCEALLQNPELSGPIIQAGQHWLSQSTPVASVLTQHLADLCAKGEA